MNTTLARFGYPVSLVRDFEHWALLVRPVQTTPLSCVIAAHDDVSSIGQLSAQAGAELPVVVRRFEAAVLRIAPAVKFNYLALMMVDPHPHFHAIPRYDRPVSIDGVSYRDVNFPRPADVLQGLEVDLATLDRWRALLTASG